MAVPCYVYAIAMLGDSPLLASALKIGIARNPASRLNGLSTGSPFKMEIRKTWKFLSEEDARNFEGACHKEFMPQNLMREWFTVTIDEIDDLYESYFTIKDVEKEASDLLHALRSKMKTSEVDADIKARTMPQQSRNLDVGRLNTKTAAAYIGKSASWLNQSRCRGDGPVYLKLGANVYYTVKDLDNWMDDNRRTAVYDFASRKTA